MYKKKVGENMKDIVSDFTGIIEKEVRLFNEKHNIKFNPFVFNEETSEESITISFNGFDVHIYAGDSLTYGYPLFEDTDSITGYCILPRFKFLFSHFYYSPYDIHNVVDSDNFETLDFHTLRDDEDVLYAIRTILSFIEINLEAITDISGNLLLQKQLKDNYEHDLSVVSKKITSEKLKEDFKKHSEKHELNLYFHPLLNVTYTFANSDKYKELDKYFKNKSQKNKLTIFEQRLYKQLNENGYEPVNQNTKGNAKKQFQTSKKKLWIEIPSYLIGGILTILTLVAVEKLNLSTFPDGLYHILGSDVRCELSFFIMLISYKAIFSTIAEALFTKKVYASKKHANDDKLESIAIVALCAATVIISGAYNYFFNTYTVALYDNGIYIGTKVKKEILPFENDKVEFYVIEGYTDPNTNIYSESSEDKELYITIDKDYENYIPGDFSDVNLLKENGIEIISVKDYTEFEDKYINAE